MLHRGSWSTSSFGEELKIGRYTVRLKRSLGEGGFAFVHLVEASNVCSFNQGAAGKYTVFCVVVRRGRR